MQLLSSFGKKGSDLSLATMQVDIEDTNYLSKYFGVVEFNPLFTAGKNAIAFNGSSFLLPGSEIKVQCIDSNGNSLYIESPKSTTQFTDVSQFVIAVHIYNEVYNGPGKLILVGQTIKHEIVRWMPNIVIDKTVQNASKVRFYNKPSLEVRPITYTIVSADTASAITLQLNFSGSFSAYAVTPTKDTPQKSINPKKVDMDYRVILNASGHDIAPQLYPTTSFNSQMDGQSITLVAENIHSPFSYIDRQIFTTASFTIKKVINSYTLQLSDAFYYPYGTNQIITDINAGNFTSSYKWIAYKTSSDYPFPINHHGGGVSMVSQSFAEILYRNIKPFTGFIARHKLYRKSLVFPGDFQLLADEPLGAAELLVDPITANKAYSPMGTFFNQVHINKYWYVFTGSVPLSLSHSVNPMIDAMKISAPNNAWPDGTSFVIVKTSAPATPNDPRYHPHNPFNFDNLTGSAYTSNFISLKGGTQYVLSTNIIMEKQKYDTNAKVSFYFTSSISSITKEKNYTVPFGLKLGDITTTDQTNIKTFKDKQMIFFVPNDDYFGTLLIVPTNCNVTLSELSLKVYGDYGFSPDILFSTIPISIGVNNEGFVFKAELFDINSTLVYSNLQTVQSFSLQPTV